MAGISQFFTTPIAVETWLGETGLGGDAYAPTTTVYGMSETRRVLTRGPEGASNSTVSTLYVPVSAESTFKVGSRVTINGQVAHVVTLDVYSGKLAHLQVGLG